MPKGKKRSSTTTIDSSNPQNLFDEIYKVLTEKHSPKAVKEILIDYAEALNQAINTSSDYALNFFKKVFSERAIKNVNKRHLVYIIKPSKELLIRTKLSMEQDIATSTKGPKAKINALYTHLGIKLLTELLKKDYQKSSVTNSEPATKKQKNTATINIVEAGFFSTSNTSGPNVSNELSQEDCFSRKPVEKNELGGETPVNQNSEEVEREREEIRRLLNHRALQK